ncbi:hypothetical protein MPH_03511 [Macrophomina phaseolina MS6]|uniref:Uncharacterized protein n=1 Tax=Macrophomina phaseolina (strain MS6) TaxID=1126212 RepID=K2R9H8_MACPH|nr:hypothetical protein MPH_03511 [Macrophomina phaseolina MS6]
MTDRPVNPAGNRTRIRVRQLIGARYGNGKASSEAEVTDLAAEGPNVVMNEQMAFQMLGRKKVISTVRTKDGHAATKLPENNNKVSSIMALRAFLHRDRKSLNKLSSPHNVREPSG